MRASFYVADVGYEDTFMQFCEVLNAEKVRRNEITSYRVQFAEAVNGKPTGKVRTRLLDPKSRIQVEE